MLSDQALAKNTRISAWWYNLAHFTIRRTACIREPNLNSPAQLIAFCKAYAQPKHGLPNKDTPDRCPNTQMDLVPTCDVWNHGFVRVPAGNKKTDINKTTAIVCTHCASCMLSWCSKMLVVAVGSQSLHSIGATASVTILRTNYSPH